MVPHTERRGFFRDGTSEASQRTKRVPRLTKSTPSTLRRIAKQMKKGRGRGKREERENEENRRYCEKETGKGIAEENKKKKTSREEKIPQQPFSPIRLDPPLPEAQLALLAIDVTNVSECFSAASPLLDPLSPLHHPFLIPRTPL